MGKVVFENKNETRIVEVAAWLEEKGQKEDFRLGSGGGAALSSRPTSLDDSVGVLSKDYHVVPNREGTRREFIGGLYLYNRGATATKWRFFMNGEKNIPFVEKLMEEIATIFSVNIAVVLHDRFPIYESKALDYSGD
jgi:hypothetical protein